MGIAGHLREKKGLYYAVLCYNTANGKRKEKWFPTKLPTRGNKKKAEEFLWLAKNNFEIPAIDLCTHNEKSNVAKDDIENNIEMPVQLFPTEVSEKVTLDDLTEDQVRELLFAD